MRHNSNITINWPNILIIIVRERARALSLALMKVITAKKPWSIRDYYINTVLMKTIERNKFLQSYLRRCQR